MEVRSFSNPKMIHYAWLVKPIWIRKVNGRLHTFGLHLRAGWRYWSLQVSL